MYVYTLHGTISLNCKVMSVLSLFDDALYPIFGDVLSPMHACFAVYVLYIILCMYICMVHEYIVCDWISAGTQRHDKGSCTLKEQLTVATIQLGGPETMET